MHTIARLAAREVLDSRGRPTVEVEAVTSGGAVGRAIVPSGASTGRHEAVELRDADRPRHGGKGVLRAVGHVEGEIAAALLGLDVADQPAIDARLIELDGTPNKGRLGANAVLGASLAAMHAAASARGVEPFEHVADLWRAGFGAGESAPGPTLPMPMVNMISGGLHAGGNLEFQDFLAVPLGAPTYTAALEMITAIYRALGHVLEAKGQESALVGDEGGYGPKLRTNAQAVDSLLEAILACGYEPGVDVGIALDVASTHFYAPNLDSYVLRGDEHDGDRMVELLEHWTRLYPIVSIEDGLAEDDWPHWAELTRRLGDRVQLIGDDLFATQEARLREGIDRGAANAVLVKLNQVGTLSETLATMHLARRHGYRCVVSARSGETEDTTIADLAVGTAAGQIKIGSVARSERLAKYNRLLRIEGRLGPDAPFAGRAALAR